MHGTLHLPSPRLTSTSRMPRALTEQITVTPCTTLRHTFDPRCKRIYTQERNCHPDTATHCNNALQHLATHVRFLLHTGLHTEKGLLSRDYVTIRYDSSYDDFIEKQDHLDHSSDCNRLQQTVADCNRLQPNVAQRNALRYAATHCNTLQHTATHCNVLARLIRHTRMHLCKKKADKKLQHTATHCNTRGICADTDSSLRMCVECRGCQCVPVRLCRKNGSRRRSGKSHGCGHKPVEKVRHLREDGSRRK